MKKYLFLLVFILLCISIDLQAQISFQSLDTVQFNTEDLTDARLVDTDQNGENELIYKLDNKIYSIKDFQDNSTANKNLIFEVEGINIRNFSNFVDYNNDGYLDFAVVTFDNESTFLPYAIFVKGSENGFVEDFRLEVNSLFYAKFIDINQDGSFEFFYSGDGKFGYVSDWKNGFEGFDLEFQQASVNGIEAIDFDNDGELEIVSSGFNSFHIYNISEALEVDLNFSASTNYTSNTISYGDINLDGFTDFIYRKQDDIYSLIYNDGQFIENNLTESLGFVNVRSPKLIDIDQNNTLDVVFRDQQDRLVYLRNQNGNFNQLETIGNTGIRSMDNLLFDDFDQDGFIDIFTYNLGVYDLIYTDQNQEIKEIFTGEFYNHSNGISSFDMDNDGNKDLVSIAKSGFINIIYDYKNNLNEEPTKYPIERDSDNLNIFDVDNDGFLDIIYFEANLSGGNSFLYLMKGLGNREFEEPVQWKYVPNGDSLFETDINNDDIKEFVTFRSFNEEIVVIHPNSGNVNDYYNSENVISIQNGNGIRAIDVGNLSNNDSEDIVTANYESQNISVLMNDGAGNFSESNIEIGTEVKNVKIFDYNFDGNNDLIIIINDVVTGNGNLQIYLNDGNSSFSLSEEFELDFYDPFNIDIYDLDNDGDSDLLISSYSYLAQELFENKEGVFEPVSVDIDLPGQVYRFYDDIDNDGRIDFYSTDISFGNMYIHYNNSVSKPSLDEFKLNIQDTSYSSVSVSHSGLTASGYFVLLKEDSSSKLNELPEDNSFYASNSSYGIGGELDGAFVVYSGNAASFEITGLNVSSTYKLFAFPYNSNSPNNTLIDYTDNYVSLNIVTNPSIYLLQDLPTLEIDEDNSTILDLSEYIFDDGINTYSASSDNQDLVLSFDSNVLEIDAINDFYGDSQIEIIVENQFQEENYLMDLIINPVNDPPRIQESTSIQVEGLKLNSFKILLYDVDNSNEELTFSINSSNNDIINTNEIDFDFIEDSIQVNFTTLKLGTSNISISVSDTTYEVSSEFEIEVVEKILSNLSEQEGVRIYPNPVHDVIYFEGLNDKSSFRIYTISGKMVMKDMYIPEELNISSFQAGVYLFVIGNKQFRFIKK
ncbi:T9SS type A sorting domain-containing protein [Marivirga tractuosa]|uniref:T9SS type A sorting domain-containing protein n=1 Tax=Marivirga tractuosa TaxID=1006 RepID=UPI0035CF2A4D